MHETDTLVLESNSALERNQQHLTRIGSAWGGLHVDLGLIPEKSLILSAGLADDLTFDLELISRKQCHVVGIDPTELAANTVKRLQRHERATMQNFRLLRRAVHAKSSLTVCLGGPAKTFLSPQGELAETISLDDLVLTFGGAALLKLDIEGAEFPALEHLTARLRVPQLAVGFHVWLNGASDQHPNEGVPPGIYTAQDVQFLVHKIKGMGYKLVYEERVQADRVGQETLFIRNDYASNYEDLALRD